MPQKPSSYFDLMEIVGSKGNYQSCLFIIMFILWSITSVLMMGTSFLFFNPKFDCSLIGLKQQLCESYVCSLPAQERKAFYEDIKIESLATQFGPYNCDKQFQLSAFRMVLFIGTFFGYLVVFYITDNYGRKYSLVMGWVVTVFGVLILSLSFNIWMVVVGLFFAGLGCESCIRITMTMIGETVENSLRQKYSIFLEISFGIGSIIIGLGYLWIENWRTITIVFCLIPSVILLFFLVFYVEQTPKFLMAKGVQKTLKALNRIAKINKSQRILYEQDVLSVAENYHVETKKRTPLDLFRYKSIRWNFIFISFSLFSLNVLYMGPTVIISELKMSIFVSQIILGATQAISYPFCSLFIERLPRKKSGYFLIGLSMVIFCILNFFEVQKGCNGCIEGIIQTILVFIARFFICSYFSVFFLYITQIYPEPLRGIGFGMTSAFGSIANFGGQFLLSSISETNINPMTIFSAFSGLAILTLCFLPQTLNKRLEEKIQEERLTKIKGDSVTYSQKKKEKIHSVNILPSYQDFQKVIKY